MAAARFCFTKIPDSPFSLIVERLTGKHDFTSLALEVIAIHRLARPTVTGCIRLSADEQPLKQLPPKLQDIAPDFADADFRGWIVSGGSPPPGS